jgi:uncharacterized membrane protein
MHDVLLFISAFLACCVEMVEAITIILAVGVTKGWRTALTGVVAASIVLAVIVAVLGVSLVNYVPLGVLQVTVGILLLVFGMQWLRKAIQRASGVRSSHDEAKIFANEVTELGGGGTVTLASTIDWQGFVVSFKGVFLEGLEVAFIVITFGANSGHLDIAAAGAVAAFFLVSGIGVVVHRPLTQVPENAIKHAVGIMLMAFGTFWGAEGVGVEWSIDAAAIVPIAAFYWLASLAFIELIKREAQHRLTVISQPEAAS